MALLAIRRVLLIVNPASRRGRRGAESARRAFDDAGVTVQCETTGGRGDAAQLARSNREGQDAVFALGGDGTVAEVAQALVGSPVPLGIVPAGTGNLVARALAIPRHPSSAVAELLHGAVRAIDVGRNERGEVLLFAAGTGIDAEMIARATPGLKRRWGVLTYIVTGTRAAAARASFDVRATVDGRVIEAHASAVFVANFGAVLGGLIHLGPDVTPDDGLLDLCVLSPRSLPDALAIAWRMFRMDFRAHPRMQFTKGRSIDLCTVPPRPVQSDGEVAGTTPVRWRVEPAALRVLVPASR